MTASPALHLPETTRQALELLQEYGDDAKVVAGGTAFSILYRGGLLRPDHIVSARGLSELAEITVDDDAASIGALVRLRDLERHTGLRRTHPVLTSAVRLVANARVRNAATLGGNIAEADPTSDPPAVLAALDATVHVESASGSRDVAFRDALVDYFETSLEPHEMITRVTVPALGPEWGGTYLKFLSRTAEDRTCLGVAAFVAVDNRGRCTGVRVAAVGANPVPLRLPEVEERFVGADLEEESLQELSRSYMEAADPVSDVRGSSAYRRRVLGVLVARAIRRAAEHKNDAVLA